MVACSLPDIKGRPWTPSNTTVGQRNPHAPLSSSGYTLRSIGQGLAASKLDSGANRFPLATFGGTARRAAEVDPMVATLPVETR
jgi:hypothetical protein